MILKLREQLVDDLAIPDWQSFVNDKSVVKERLTPVLDQLMSDAGLAYWVTREYRPASARWSRDEIRHGLNRTYRVILQQNRRPPPGLVDRIKRVREVEDAHELIVGDVTLPVPELSVSASAVRTAADLIYLSYAKAITRGSPEVKVAVLDTGVNLDHQELQGKIVKRADFVDLTGLDTTNFIGDITDFDEVPEDEVGHGTHVSGIIAGRGVQMDEGVSPDCRLIAVRVLATMRDGDRLVGAGIVDNINPGIKWAVDNGADVINMSLGIKHVGGGLPHEDVIRYALSKGVTVVAASGNDGTSERYYPGALPGVIAVGAVDNSGAIAPFTSFGAPITVSAPGVNIHSSFAHNTYAVASGTSQASPFVAGSVGLMKSFARQHGRTVTTVEIVDILKHTSDRVDNRLRNEQAGYGVLNLADAFKLLAHSSS
jgi:thermitase